MKSLLLIAATSLTDVEAAVLNVTEKIKAEKKNAPSVRLLFGRSADLGKVSTADIVIMLGVNTFQVCQDLIRHDAVGILLGDPMNLGCIVGRGVKKVDFKPRIDGYGYFLNRASVADLSRLFLKEVKAKKDDSIEVTIKSLDFIPTLLRSVSDSVSFVQDLAAFWYSLRSEQQRDKFKHTFIKWVITNDSPDVFITKAMNVAGMKKATPRLESLADVFRGGQGENTRSAIKSVLAHLTKEAKTKDGKKKPIVIDFERIAALYHVSAYDLRYIASLARKKPFLLEDMTVAEAHKHLEKMRYEMEAADAEASELVGETE